jgi:hypothetical protein
MRQEREVFIHEWPRIKQAVLFSKMIRGHSWMNALLCFLSAFAVRKIKPNPLPQHDGGEGNDRSRSAESSHPGGYFAEVAEKALLFHEQVFRNGAFLHFGKRVPQGGINIGFHGIIF